MVIGDPGEATGRGQAGGYSGIVRQVLRVLDLNRANVVEAFVQSMSAMPAMAGIPSSRSGVLHVRVCRRKNVQGPAASFALFRALPRTPGVAMKGGMLAGSPAHHAMLPACRLSRHAAQFAPRPSEVLSVASCACGACNALRRVRHIRSLHTARRLPRRKVCLPAPAMLRAYAMPECCGVVMCGVCAASRRRKRRAP